MQKSPASMSVVGNCFEGRGGGGGYGHFTISKVGIVIIQYTGACWL